MPCLSPICFAQLASSRRAAQPPLQASVQRPSVWSSTAHARSQNRATSWWATRSPGSVPRRLGARPRPQTRAPRLVGSRISFRVPSYKPGMMWSVSLVETPNPNPILFLTPILILILIPYPNPNPNAYPKP